MRAEPTGLAGRRLNRSAKVSPVASLVEAVECGLLQNPPPMGDFMGGCLSSPLGSGEMVGGPIAILAVGWWVALEIFCGPP